MSIISSVDSIRKSPQSKRAKSRVKYAEGNERILKWWDDRHDDVVVSLIQQYKWYWHWMVADEVVKITDDNRVEKWKREDPLCEKRAPNGVIRDFAITRAEKKGFFEEIPEPILRECVVCGEVFRENAHKVEVIRLFGNPQRVDFCPVCWEPNYMGNRDKEDIDNFIYEFKAALGRVPTKKSLKNWKTTLSNVEDETRISLMKIGNKPMPNMQEVLKVYDSWTEALVRSGVLGENAIETKYGTKCLAKDGDVCYSIGEKVIDDFLYEKGVEHQKEPEYPEHDYRADFRVGDVFIEYFGLQGDDEYDKKTKEKKRICEEKDIDLIDLYPDDVSDHQALEERLSLIL